ncbi:MAG: phosphohistidine phosphatase, partial [Solirubrobacterales bacterium]|nr:phosphohistidine phosphatase [Solirubrobacterales bacterium]
MARQLWMLRHGEAEPHGTRPDSERELTERGRQQGADAGRALARLDVRLAAVFSSPKVRAHATATAAAAALGTDVVLHAPLADAFDAEEALLLLAAAEDGERILVVGHEPDFSQVVHDLTGADVDFKKGGVAVIRLAGNARRGELLALL